MNTSNLTTFPDFTYQKTHSKFHFCYKHNHTILLLILPPPPFSSFPLRHPFPFPLHSLPPLPFPSASLPTAVDETRILRRDLTQMLATLNFKARYLIVHASLTRIVLILHELKHQRSLEKRTHDLLQLQTLAEQRGLSEHIQSQSRS